MIVFLKKNINTELSKIYSQCSPKRAQSLPYSRLAHSRWHSSNLVSQQTIHLFTQREIIEIWMKILKYLKKKFFLTSSFLLDAFYFRLWYLAFCLNKFNDKLKIHKIDETKMMSTPMLWLISNHDLPKAVQALL